MPAFCSKQIVFHTRLPIAKYAEVHIIIIWPSIASCTRAASGMANHEDASHGRNCLVAVSRSYSDRAFVVHIIFELARIDVGCR